MGKAKEILKNTKLGILEQIMFKLKNCDEEEIYFHDIVFQEIDSQTPQNRKICFDLIELADEKYFDSGMIDESSFDRSLITRAFLSIEQNLFNDDFIQYLQKELNNEKISKSKAKEILKKVETELKSLGYYIQHKNIYEDNQTQIFINVPFSVNSLTKEDFLKYGLKESQLIDLSDSFKILTSNKSINQNALVIEEKKRDVNKKEYVLRIYLMEKDKGLDIRNLFKLKCISEETGFNLSPSAYMEQITEQYEKDKLHLRKNYLTSFRDKTSLVKQLINIANKLTERTI